MRHTAKCVEPGCNQIGNYCRNRCCKHYTQFRAQLIRDGKWSREMTFEDIHIEHFVWEGNETELARVYGGDENGEARKHAKTA